MKKRISGGLMAAVAVLLCLRAGAGTFYYPEVADQFSFKWDRMGSVSDKSIRLGDNGSGETLAKAFREKMPATFIIPRCRYTKSGNTYNYTDDLVTHLAMWSFYSSTTVTTFVFEQPSKVRYIGSRAFANCTALQTIAIPTTVTEVGDYIFSGCTALKTIRAPKTLKGTVYETYLKQGNSATIVWYGDHLITWKNGYGGTIDTTDAMEGEVPTHAKPTRPSTAQYNYTFKAWTPTVVAATNSTTYTATWTSSLRSYTITWQQDTGTKIDTTTVSYGTKPTHANPTKAADAQYTYAFAGWSPAVATCTGAATYKATYNRTLRSYAITWKGEDGATLDTTTVAYGTVPTHAAPTKDEDDDYTYTFAGWDAEPVAVTGEATYTAVFTATAKAQPSADIGGAAGADALRVVGLAPTEAAGVWDVTVEPTLKESVDFAAWVAASAGRIKVKTARDPSGVDAAVAQALEPMDSDPERARVTLRVDTTDDTEEGGDAAGRAFIRIIAE